jgi:hypothetical protein
MKRRVQRNPVMALDDAADSHGRVRIARFDLVGAPGGDCVPVRPDAAFARS